MNDRVQRIATAALLHDIGKFWSRTGLKRPFTRQVTEHFSGYYEHSLWSGQFIEDHLDDGELAGWARDHHKPDSRESWLISLADHLSSGERIQDEDVDIGRAKDAPLVTILSELDAKEDRKSVV